MADAKTKDGRDVTWISGGANFEVTHYTYALENDPIHTGSAAEKIEAPGLGGAKYKRGFLGAKYGVGMQGTGLAEDGKYIMYNGKDSKGNIQYKYGVGGAYRQVTKPYEQIAVDKSVIPYGTQVYVENYPDKVMSADDCGGAIKGNHIDVFAGPVPIKTAYALGTKHGRVGIVSGTAQAQPQGSQGSATNKPGTSSGNTSSTSSGTGNEQVYVVKSGDTLSKIATKFNVSGGYKALASFNNIANPNIISVGQKIRIPGTTAATNVPAEKKEESGSDDKSQAQTTTVVVNSSLNIRSEPNTNCKVVGSLRNGDKVTYTEDKNGWLRITSPKAGYISKKYTKLNPEAGNGGAGGAGAVSGGTNVSALAKPAVDFAINNIGSNAWKKDGMTYCQGFVADATAKSIGQRYSKGSAAEACEAWAVSTDQSNIPAGAAIYFYSNTTNGKKYGHVGLSIGGGEVVHVAGAVKRTTLSNLYNQGWCSFRAWGWNGGVELN